MLQSRLHDELHCSYKFVSGEISAEGTCDNRSINYCNKSLHTNETPLGQNKFNENNIINNCIYDSTILKEINGSLIRNDDVLETVNKNVDTNINDMLYDYVQCVPENDINSGFNDAVEYLMDDLIKEFIDECFIKDVIFDENSLHNHFYDKDSANNHDTLANNNCNNASISTKVNDAESAIRHDKITIHSICNFGNKQMPILLLLM